MVALDKSRMTARKRSFKLLDINQFSDDPASLLVNEYI